MKTKLIKTERPNGVLPTLAGAQLKGLKRASVAMAGASPHLETCISGRVDQALQLLATTPPHCLHSSDLTAVGFCYSLVVLQGVSINKKAPETF